MRNKKIRSICASLLSLVMVFSILTPQAFAVTQAEVDAMEQKRDELRAQRDAQQAVIDELESQQASILEKKYAMDERNQVALEQIELNGQEIELYNQMIKAKADELDEALRLEQEQLERYRLRVRAMEENGNLDILSLVLNTNDLGELLTAMDDIGEIMESDRRLEDQYIAARENTQTVKAEYESTRQELEAKQAELKAEQQELEKGIEEAYMMLAEVEADIANNLEAYEQLEAAEREACAAFDALAAELEAQRLAAQVPTGGGGSTIVGTGQFAWPTPSCSIITSYYGHRMHPVYNYERLHTGVDIGAADGAEVIAADDGTVAHAGWMGGYGNCIMIDHGNGYTTLYAHLSSIAVSSGSTVSRGNTIGYVGSTGVSTGPHLHYEVRENGSCVDPMAFY